MAEDLYVNRINVEINSSVNQHLPCNQIVSLFIAYLWEKRKGKTASCCGGVEAESLLD